MIIVVLVPLDISVIISVLSSPLSVLLVITALLLQVSVSSALLAHSLTPVDFAKWKNANNAGQDPIARHLG